MAALLDRLAARIRRDGPLTVADYMAACLGDPEHGYYRNRDPLGAGGDFVTAPEVSQIFGELIGAWAAACWAEIGRPAPLRLVELGPGRGTLMADALRVTAKVAPDFRAAVDLHLVETSPALRARQAQALAPHAPRWHDDLATVPDGAAIVIANEFFDALPIRQLLRSGEGWRERMVALAPPGDALAFTLGAAGVWPFPDRAPPEAPIGTIVEICPAAIAIATAIGRRLAAQGGAALVIDYGAPHGGFGDTLQSVHRHRRHDPLDRPGEADLTAHVDFPVLAAAAAAAGARLFGPLPQGAFLTRLGLLERAAALARRADAAARVQIEAALHRLAHPRAMGALFQALALMGAGAAVAPGFDAGEEDGSARRS